MDTVDIIQVVQLHFEWEVKFYLSSSVE